MMSDISYSKLPVKSADTVLRLELSLIPRSLHVNFFENLVITHIKKSTYAQFSSYVEHFSPFRWQQYAKILHLA